MSRALQDITQSLRRFRGNTPSLVQPIAQLCTTNLCTALVTLYKHRRSTLRGAFLPRERVRIAWRMFFSLTNVLQRISTLALIGKRLSHILTSFYRRVLFAVTESAQRRSV